MLNYFTSSSRGRRRWKHNIIKLFLMKLFFFFFHSEFREFRENIVKTRAGVHSRWIVRVEFRKPVRRNCVGQLRGSGRSHHQLQTGRIRWVHTCSMLINMVRVTMPNGATQWGDCQLNRISNICNGKIVLPVDHMGITNFNVLHRRHSPLLLLSIYILKDKIVQNMEFKIKKIKP